MDGIDDKCHRRNGSSHIQGSDLCDDDKTLASCSARLKKQTGYESNLDLYISMLRAAVSGDNKGAKARR